VFTESGSGQGQALVFNQDGSSNSLTAPALRRDVITFYATGEGQTTADALPMPVLPVTVRIGGVQAELIYAGAAEGLSEGMMQVSARVPADVAASGNVSLELRVGTASSQSGVTVAIR
jgi:trimeric autotransporter adhesin